MFGRVIFLAVILQVTTGSPTVSLVLDTAANVTAVLGEGVALGFDGAGNLTKHFVNKTEKLQLYVKNKTASTTDNILELLDLKMEFIMCNMFQVCTKNTSDETDAPGGRSGLNQVNRLTELNNLILAEATDEVVEDERLFFPVENQKDYIKNKIKKLLCKYTDDKWCEKAPEEAPEEATEEAPEARLFFNTKPAENATEAAVDDTSEASTDETTKPTATLTKSLFIQKLFSHLSIKMGFVLCNLRVWCPDEELAF
ncbi:uncharacterized protein LOC111712509 [Eurytemora carolleeae]|uniref:uncharacterized protein LOC111712509 n=1 Tax=Eurytemora carolleeae TaxID=1294199 RepID=UPI000C760DA7|nr:uncharacterized protein LOC111712509 [Eurytemora carolleeae]|eukprot:XP_023342912.1 uncharacterized protein LOC111712509 [Eurytemora affinis]